MEKIIKSTICAIDSFKIIEADESAKTQAGIVIHGRETVFGVKNLNGQVYERGCFDEFVKDFFIKNHFNMVLTLEHDGGAVGVVKEIDVDDEGITITAFIPEGCERYVHIKAMLECGALQGFSKEAWLTDFTEDNDGTINVKNCALVNMSLVSYPANMQLFDNIENVNNTLTYRTKKENNKFKKLLK